MALRSEKRVDACLIAALCACSSEERSPGTEGTGGASEVDGASTGASDAGGDASGGARATGGSAGAGGTAQACTPALARCEDDPEACCEGSVCVPDVDGERRCRQTCAERSDCGTFCCVDDPSLGMKLCAAESMCPSVCVEEGGECPSNGPRCCEPLICVASTSAEFAGCRPACETTDDCEEGCCVPFAAGQSGFCVTGGACECADQGETCGGVTHCCEGLACSTFDETGAFACQPKCNVDTDCATDCCVDIFGTNERACLPPMWCGE